jgi:hypothetical protein
MLILPFTSTSCSFGVFSLFKKFGFWISLKTRRMLTTTTEIEDF